MRPNPSRSHRAMHGAGGRKRSRVRSLEREGWQAEADGLEDALLNTRYSKNQYQDYPPCVFKRYVMGFQDGQALIHAAAADQHFATPLT